MRFLIAESFPKAIAKLTNHEQKAVKTTVFDLQIDPSSPGLQFHRIDNSNDSNFWSMRVNRDIRLIIHKTADSFLVCYVDHHDDAYKWAERRRIETHPKTGAAQIVEVRERVEEIVVQQPVEVIAPESEEVPEPLLFEHIKDEILLRYGVPEDWLDDVKQATESTILDLADHLPGEAADALLALAVGEQPDAMEYKHTPSDPFLHPDAQRRFRVMENVEELKRALDFPWDQWTVFLHPSQRRVVETSFNGPARVSGSAGTGKTVVALHRAAQVLNEHPDAKLLLTTFAPPLANALERKLELLTGKDESIVHKATILPFQGVARDLFTLIKGHDPLIAKREHVEGALKAASDVMELDGFTDRFVYSEWVNIVDAWQIANEADYASVPRIGRKNRLGSKQRAALWPVFEKVRELLQASNRLTWSMVFAAVTDHFSGESRKPFTHVIVDEAQDLGVPELRMLTSIVMDGTDTLYFAGDLGQRIFQDPFSWKALGVDIRGRSRTLKVNYRTSHQIRTVADKLLPNELRDADGNLESRKGTVSVFNGPVPDIRLHESKSDECAAIVAWVSDALTDGVSPDEIGVFVRSFAELKRARQVAKELQLPVLELSERYEDGDGRLHIGTMHFAKGLEFKAVVVMACDDEVLPSQERLETAADNEELQSVYETERHLFYVACTRARDRLLVTGVAPGSEFVEDLIQQS